MGNSRKRLYLLFISELNVCKIGISENVENRIKQLQTGCPFKIDVVRSYSSPISSRIEKVLHRQFQTRKADENEHNLLGEWFNLTLCEVLRFEDICRDIERNIEFLKKSGNPFI